MRPKQIVVIIAGFLLVALFAFCGYLTKKDNEKDAAYRAWQEERRSAEVECRDLERQIKLLEQNYKELTTAKATTQVLFTDLNKDIYKECYPYMLKKGMAGTLAVNSSQFPGKEGCITVEQYQELVEKGWNVCVQWESSPSLESWWRSLQSEMVALNMNPNGVIYFPRGTYQTSLDKRLSRMGFQIVISEKEDEESPLQTAYEDGLWHIGAMGSMTSKPKKWLKEAVAQDANIIFTAGFQLEYQKYEESSFQRMLSTFEEYVVSRDLLVCSPTEAREHYKNCLNGISPEVELKYQEDKEKLEKKLQKAKKTLENIDEQYQ